MSSEKVIAVVDSGFDKFVTEAPVPVLVDFWAPWCVPCKQLMPTVESLAKKFGDQLIVAKVNVDENRYCLNKHKVRGIPSLLLFKGGKVVEMVIGLRSKDDLEVMITKYVGA